MYVTLPIIDVSPLREDLDAAGETARALDQACRETGFFLVEGHGIPPEVRAALFDAARALFALDDEAKAELSIERSNCHRGYVGFERETLGVGVPADLKECFELSRDLGPEHPEVAAGTPLYGPNQWPPIPGFREAVEAYFASATQAAEVICTGLAIALDLPPTFFTDRMVDALTNLRLLHYPSRESRRPQPGQPGCGEHTDYGMVTLLAEDSTGGLQLRRRDGTWVSVHATPDQLIVNIGDMLAHWTNGRWTSTMHRAGNPLNLDRYSIPFFVNPGFHETVEPLFIEEGAEPPPPMTAGEYLLSRFDSTHDYRQTV